MDIKPLKINEQQHDDFIWTWKNNSKSSKVSLWLPYFSEVSRVKKTSRWIIKYNGGEIEADLAQVDFLLFYGATGSLPLEFLDELSKYNIIFIIHRRNIIKPYIFIPSNLSDTNDILSNQILYRSNEIKRCYIARTIIHQKLNSMNRCCTMYVTYYDELGKTRNIDAIRSVEAKATARFWKYWYKGLQLETSRRSESPINIALDAGSKFIYGILLRWILFHKLSPCHGYLHVTTDYPSLVYDLIEPYRYIIEESAVKAYNELDGSLDTKDLTSYTLNNIKDYLEEIIYVPATRQYTRRKNLLHGVVLALRAYLSGDSLRFIIPTEGVKKGGRPVNIGFKLPGEVKKQAL